VEDHEAVLEVIQHEAVSTLDVKAIHHLEDAIPFTSVIALADHETLPLA